MDNVITTTSIAAINDSPPPPRLPPRASRQADTDSEPPPIPRHSPPPPPIPAREPLTPQTRLVVPRTVHHHGGGHHGPAITTGPTQASQQQQPAGTGVLHPVSVDRLPPALDRVVPVSLSHWPFRTCTDNYIVKTLDNHNTHHHLHPVVQQTPRRSGGNVVDTGAPSPPPLLPSVVLPSHTAGNEYVDAPTQLRRGNNAAASPSATAPSTARRVRAGVEPLPVPASTNCLRVQTLPSVVVTQPTSPSTTKFHNVDDLNAGTHGGEKCGGARSSTEGACRGAVLCSRCGRCRCASCTAPRELPRHWFGDCECSVQRCVGVTSCVCCVEALFYHFLDGGGAADGGCDAAADDPCACCERPRCCVRWTLMGALAATVLPCLWCYCPLQCAADAATSCYNGCTASRGCRCGGGVAGAQEASSSGASTRGLLAESESSST